MADVNVSWLGTVEYGTAWELQKQCAAARAAETAPDTLLLLEHPPTYTFGRRGNAQNLLFTPQRLEKEGIRTFWVDRGGDVTYHGPGQLVGYPILDLKQRHAAQGLPRPDLHRYLRQLEQVIIDTLSTFDVQGWRYDGFSGVWVTSSNGPRKIAAIGVKVNGRGITSHGFALNVDPEMEHFSGIVPCGIAAHGVTSMQELMQRAVTILEVRTQLVEAFATVFGVTTAIVTPTLSS